jgi:hypothetical protein
VALAGFRGDFRRSTEHVERGGELARLKMGFGEKAEPLGIQQAGSGRMPCGQAGLNLRDAFSLLSEGAHPRCRCSSRQPMSPARRKCFRNRAQRITLTLGSGPQWQQRYDPAMDLLNALLDLADAISAAVALTGFWHTWVLPADSRVLWLPRSASAPDELERFLRAATQNKPSGQEIT